ncbi:SDR family NAD(P)-dependent oxidoreductase [Devosia sp.]|uniref:SDR family NAD(P)-dependent oxidoreductase n=1 Tax=Devosia sp. TaxID=1871048 RepID=UPI002EDE18F2
MAPLTGTVSLVLGASQGIGAAIAAALAGDGAAVVLASRRLEAVEAVARELHAQGRHALAVACDVADAAAVETAVAKAIDRFGRLDHLVNNAAIVEPLARLAETDPAAWARAAHVNIVGTYHGCRAALRAFRPRGSGVIVNLSSGAAHRPLEGWSAYCASKAATLALLRNLAEETANTGIRVYGFQPGAVDTGMVAQIRETGVGYVAQLPKQDLLPPALPARAVAWLMRPDAGDLAGRELSIRDPELRARVGLPERHYA